jgi:hypothetical protein
MEKTKRGCDSCSCSSEEQQDVCAKCTEKEAFQRELDAYRSSWEVRINSGI